MKIVAVIPAFNEERSIEAVISGVKQYVDTVLVIDDGSTDRTATLARKAGARVVYHVENCGVGAATMTGVKAARLLGADIIITLDADEQHDPHDIPTLLQPVQKDAADIVFANRFGRRNLIPGIRRLFNGIGNILTFAATGRWIEDSQCGFKVFGPRAVQELNLRMNGFEFCTEIVRESVQNRWRIAQVPVKVLYSEFTLAKGQSFAGGVKTAFKILLRSFFR